MELRILVADGAGGVQAVDQPPELPLRAGWVWVDVRAGAEDVDTLLELATPLGFDQIAVRDAVLDVDMPKVDDFGDHLLMVLHSLRNDAIATYEIDCFLTAQYLITVRPNASAPIDALWQQAQQRRDVGRLGIDELAAVLADLLTRSLLTVLDAVDLRVEELNRRALTADPTLLEDLTAVRTDVVGVRRVVHPLREALDVMRHSTSDLVTEAGRRRFSDVFDLASRVAAGLDEARAALAETLDAYRGAEARQATEVSKVLTVYAAIMLPLSLIAGFWGMNFTNLPWTGTDWGWYLVTGIMIVVAIVSLGMFISLGWVHKPSGRRAGRAIGQGLLEATKTPVHIVGAVLEISAMPLRATTARLSQVAGVEHTSSAARSDDKPRQPAVEE